MTNLRVILPLLAFACTSGEPKPAEDSDTNSPPDVIDTETSEPSDTDAPDTDPSTPPDTDDTTDDTDDTTSDTDDGTTDTEPVDPTAVLAEDLSFYASFESGYRFQGTLTQYIGYGDEPPGRDGGAVGRAMSPDHCFADAGVQWTGANEISFAFWYKVADPTMSTGAHVISHQIAAIDYGAFQIRLFNEELTFEVYSSAGVHRFTITNTTETERWYHAAFSLDIANEEVHGWLDGTEQTLTYPGLPAAILQGQGSQFGLFQLQRDNCTGPAQIGAMGRLQLDEFRIYHRAIEDSDIALLYPAP